MAGVLADLLRWVRGGDEVQTFLSLFDREMLEGQHRKSKRPSSKRVPTSRRAIRNGHRRC